MADADRLVAEVTSRPPAMGSSRLLAIDGPAGSGKTTLAREVSRRLGDIGFRVALVSLDDLYDGWDGLDPALAVRVIDQVLEPLAHGRSATWQAYDWSAQTFADWHEIPLPDVLVLEGCGAGARALAPYTTLLVWLETAPETGTARMVARDGPEVLDHLVAWRHSEDRHFAANGTHERADIIMVT